MTCREVSESLLDYRSAALSQAARVAFEAHLADCERCAEYAADYDAVVRLARAALQTPSEESVPDSLVRQILAAARARS